MNVTKQEYKGRKFRSENCSQKVDAEQRRYAGVPASVWIAENKYINAGAIWQGVFERSEQGVPQGGVKHTA